ncbi:ACP S-malonyltransferase [Aureimonas frigidaquae]|uniref:Malonyl CoA-acyl carrier protein transacylase n=1 Tax=Aureimonas frigidaquae TaxID=424757 RepID=A0A0P0Z2S9_9HYPH|nr:ACP S-malonyltransferase [Aureimonas frigidaquae]BAT28306.1 malonyl CoA-acyl carrier protein transacylase [Aureimonas frigidaquae]
MTFALVFPGQGSQAVGMGRDLYDTVPASRAVFDAVDDALGEKLSTLIFEGPEDALTLTANAQPALMAVSLAALRAMEARGFDVASAAYVAGHSLGEYSALAAAGSLDIGETARLLRIRGEAMQAAVPPGAGAMAAIIGLEHDDVAALCVEAAEGGSVQIANDNGGGQLVVSGDKAAVERAMALASARGAKRAIALQVSAPFHSALMHPAADRMAEALIAVDIRTPKVPLIANVLAAPVSDPERIRAQLVEQVTGQVRWRESMTFLAEDGVDMLFEVGAGKVLSGLARRIDKRLSAQSVGTSADVEAAMTKLQGE